MSHCELVLDDREDHDVVHYAVPQHWHAADGRVFPDTFACLIKRAYYTTDQPPAPLLAAFFAPPPAS